MGPYAVGWEADSALYGPYAPDQPRNRGRVNDPKLAAMVQEQRRLQDPEARKHLIFAMQRYAAEQQYYVYLSSQVVKIGRAACRERVEISVVAVSLKKKKKKEGR